MTPLEIGALVVVGGLVVKQLFSRPSTPADPAPPVVPQDGGGQVLPQDPNGQPMTPATAPSGKAKVPMPTKPKGWVPTPRFYESAGVTYYNGQYAAVLRDVLNARTMTPLGYTTFRLDPIGTPAAGKAHALTRVKQAQDQGSLVLVGRGLLEGDSGQTGAYVLVLTKADVKAASIAAYQNQFGPLAVLPKV